VAIVFYFTWLDWIGSLVHRSNAPIRGAFESQTPPDV
jgi:hypothetical protein